MPLETHRHTHHDTMLPGNDVCSVTCNFVEQSFLESTRCDDINARILDCVIRRAHPGLFLRRATEYTDMLQNVLKSADAFGWILSYVPDCRHSPVCRPSFTSLSSSFGSSSFSDGADTNSSTIAPRPDCFADQSAIGTLAK